MKVVWTQEWPDKPGYYWFFGYTSLRKVPSDIRSRLMFVKVHQGANSLVCIADGQFLYPSEAYGLFAVADIPELPNSP